MKTNSLNHCALSGFKNYFELYLTIKSYVHEDNAGDFHTLIGKQIEYLTTADMPTKMDIAHEVNELFVGLYEELYDITDMELVEEISEYKSTYLECHYNIRWLNQLDSKYKVYPIKSYETHLQEVAQSVSDGFGKCAENISKMYENLQSIAKYI